MYYNTDINHLGLFIYGLEPPDAGMSYYSYVLEDNLHGVFILSLQRVAPGASINCPEGRGSTPWSSARPPPGKVQKCGWVHGSVLNNSQFTAKW